jgi:AcrR family transcriptional regulator
MADVRWATRQRPPGEPDPRVQRSRDRALEAARTVLLEEGWEALTQQRVAEIAGIGRATVYRLWPERSSLLHDLCVQEMRTMRTRPTGDLRADLLAELGAMRTELIDRHFDTVLVTLTDRASFEPVLRKIKLALIGHGTENMRERLESAMAAGELAPLDLEEAVAFLVAPLVYRHIFAEQEVSLAALRNTVDDFLDLRTPRRRSRRPAPLRRDAGA